MNTIEDRLSGALRDQAQTFTVEEHAAALEGVRHRVRRQRRQKAATGVAAVGAIVAAVLCVPVVADLRAAGTRDPVSTRATEQPRETVDFGGSNTDQLIMARYPPKGGISVVEPAPGGHGMKIKVWVSSERGDPVLCYAFTRKGGGGAGCGSGALSSLSHSKRGVLRQGVQLTETGGEMAYGVTSNRVASVTVTLTDGGELPGRLVRLNDSAQFWQGGAPEAGTVKEYVFKDKDGKVVWHYPWVWKPLPPGTFCRSPLRRPVAAAVDLAGTGNSRLSASYLDRCVTFWHGGNKGGLNSLDRSHVPARVWARWASDRWWYGMADPATARVELRLPDGRRIPGRVIRPAWEGAQVVLFAGDLQRERDLRDGTLTGYDAAGKVLWTG